MAGPDQRRVEDLSELLDALPSLVAFVGPDERNHYANRASRTWLGREPDEVLGLTVRELLGDEAYAVAARHVEAALRGRRQSFERTVVRPGGEVVVALTVYVPRMRDGAPDGFTVLVTDVTRQVVAEDAHAALLTQTRRAADQADDVLQELFAISLHLERMRRLADEWRPDADVAIDALLGSIEQLRATVKQLVSDSHADQR